MFFTSLPMRPKLRHDVAMATSGRNLKVKRRLKVKGL